MSDTVIQETLPEVVQDDVVEKRNSIKSRLRRVFLLLSTGIILLICVFSVVYFYLTTRESAVDLIRNKVQLAEIFMENQKTATYEFAKNMESQRLLNYAPTTSEKPIFALISLISYSLSLNKQKK